MPAQLTQEDFIHLSNQVHGGIYDYSEVVYINFRTPVTIICHQHGPWQVKPHLHTSNKTGCPVCGQLVRRTTGDKFFAKCATVHPTLDFSNCTYTGIKKPVHGILCSMHGSFHKRASDLQAGKGCPKCAKSHNGQYKWTSYFKDSPASIIRPAEVYFYRFTHKETGYEFFKIGITTVGSAKRLRGYKDFEKKHLASATVPLKEAVALEERIQSLLSSDRTKFTLFDRYFYGKTECYDLRLNQVHLVCDLLS